MKASAIIVDDFFADFDAVRRWADCAKFEDVTSPVDGVVYPDLCGAIPPWILSEMLAGASDLLGWMPVCRTIFARLSVVGRVAPHQAHTDASMGQYSMMVYLNRPEHCAGGTSILRHIETGAERNPTDAEGEAIWKRDTNVPDAWERTVMCGMKPNRALIFQADLYHRAEPIGGFGSNSKDGRTVLIMFFDKGRA